MMRGYPSPHASQSARQALTGWHHKLDGVHYFSTIQMIDLAVSYGRRSCLPLNERACGPGVSVAPDPGSIVAARRLHNTAPGAGRHMGTTQYLKMWFIEFRGSIVEASICSRMTRRPPRRVDRTNARSQSARAEHSYALIVEYVTAPKQSQFTTCRLYAPCTDTILLNSHLLCSP